MWQQPETSWTGFVGGYLLPGALYFNREVRPQGTDLLIYWENCVTPFEKRHISTCADLAGADISTIMRPKLLSKVTLKTKSHIS